MPLSFATAFDRVRRLLQSPEVRELRDPEADVVQIEEYIPGVEYALEGVLDTACCACWRFSTSPIRSTARSSRRRSTSRRRAPPPATQRQIVDAVAARGAARSACTTVRFTRSAASTPRGVLRARSRGAADRRAVREGAALRRERRAAAVDRSRNCCCATRWASRRRVDARAAGRRR